MNNLVKLMLDNGYSKIALNIVVECSLCEMLEDDFWANNKPNPSAAPHLTLEPRQ